MIELRSVELEFPATGAAADFLVRNWGLAPSEAGDDAIYLRGSGRFPYLVGLFEATEEKVRSVTFVCDADDLEAIARRAEAHGQAVRRVTSSEPGGGGGIEIILPDGELFRFLAGSSLVPPIDGQDLAHRLTHVVLNARDAERSATFAEQVLGCKVSDRTKGMVFVRCNRSHHAIAFARAGYSSLNHIAFEMPDIDGVMRGIGRMRDLGTDPVWGPGRHGPGGNVFAYFIAPFGAVIEFSTATDLVDDDYPTGSPEDWVWPPNRIDQWGVSGKDLEAIGEAEKRFRFATVS